jgi:outer membrane biogenesis lipoprotein LolB
MKKTKSLLALLGVVASLSLTACATQPETPDANTETPGAAPTEEPATPPAEGQ